jgi:excisionase family DNA binding protein
MDNSILLQQVSKDELADMLTEIIQKELAEKLPEPPKPEAEYITRQEAADRLKVSLVTLDKYIRQGLFRAVKFGRTVRLTKTEVEEALDKLDSIKFGRR